MTNNYPWRFKIIFHRAEKSTITARGTWKGILLFFWHGLKKLYTTDIFTVLEMLSKHSEEFLTYVRHVNFPCRRGSVVTYQQFKKSLAIGYPRPTRRGILSKIYVTGHVTVKSPFHGKSSRKFSDSVRRSLAGTPVCGLADLLFSSSGTWARSVWLCAICLQNFTSKCFYRNGCNIQDILAFCALSSVGNLYVYSSFVFYLSVFSVQGPAREIRSRTNHIIHICGLHCTLVPRSRIFV